MKVLAILGGEEKESFKRVKYGIKTVEADILILSGMDERMVRYSKELGYKYNIILESSISTHNDAKNVRKILDKLGGYEKVYIATSNYHVPSCKIIFNSYLNKIPHEIVPLPTCLSTKEILKRCGIETLSILKDIPIYLCRFKNGEVVYDKTFEKIKNFLFKKFLRKNKLYYGE